MRVCTEEWKKITGHENYSVSNYGRVRNDKTSKILKPYMNNCGYEKVKVYTNGVKSVLYIHRLVAIAFIPNDKKYLEINHKDENKLNNKVSNLEWCARKYNMNYATVRKRISESLKAYHRQKRLKINTI